MGTPFAPVSRETVEASGGDMSTHIKHILMGAAVLVLAGGSVLAQNPASGAPPARQAPSQGAPPTASTPRATSAADLSGKEKSFIKDTASGGLAEVQLGRLAVQKASSPEVKQFAQRMVDDHSKANDQLVTLARQKNIDVPTEVKGKHASELKRLSNLSGAEFDREYMRVMLDDHKKHVDEFRKVAKEARDPDVKLFASQTLPALEEHLTQAQRLAPARDVRGTSGTQPPPRPTDSGISRPGTDPLGRPAGEPEPGRPESDPGNPR